MSSSLEALKSEWYRLTTYKTWPEWANAKPEDLARAGLFYMGIHDKVRCIFCNGMISDWEVGDMPFNEHAKHFPACQFIQGVDVGNIPISNSISSLVSCGQKYSKSPAKPHHPRYISEQERMKTFLASSLSFPDVRNLVKAGFFFPGYGDSTHCFHCDISLRDWKKTDDAFVEHARWSPQCRFLQEIKGQDYINQVLARLPTPLSPGPSSAPSTSGNVNHEKINVADIMQSPKVEAVIEMGYSPGMVKKVIENHIRNSGTDFESAEALLVSLMDLTEDDDSFLPSAGLQANNCDSFKTESVFDTTETEKNSRPTTFKFDFPNKNEKPKKKGSSPEALLCKICMENDIAVSFIPCGHFVTCRDCSKKVQECPICRNRIRGTLRTYLS